ncbi:MAG: zinc-dependent alcohol dehydrogenase family protein [Solirubrobacterales bacterium]|nr:zinc-dependent alcohol dehydrogenase family protein [Solirubrobacterales bacterium]MCB8969669.1 zinc-dependent alcohol dehydrogenase family protein [Thermoleophilales bacterium]MCO5327944.1 zinc-dependent alcohol dehydrogenase family protein [Solirubrobacterales bacterium]
MRAMVLDQPGDQLREAEVADPRPDAGEVVIEVEACGVCRTDLHVLDGELPDPVLPLILGHQAVGRVRAVGEGASLEVGQRVGAPWLAWTCGECERCREGRENLCARALFHGYTRDGGYAELMAVDSRFALPLDPDPPAAELAPLLCAGLIGYRALRMCADAERIGLFGFGSSAHLICRLLVMQGREAYAFTRDGDDETAAFARSLGAVWAGGSSERPPEELDAAIIFAPAGELVPAALRLIRPGGTLVCAGIHMSDIPSFPYDILWEERSIRSVANLTRRDGLEFLPMATRRGLTPTVTTYPLTDAQRALEDLRTGRVEGSAVLEI